MKKPAKRYSFSVLIPDGESIFALKVLRCLGKIKGLKIYVLSNNPTAPIGFSRFCSKILTYTENNDSDRLKAIQDALSKTKADVILPVDVKTIRLLSGNLNEIDGLAAIGPLPAVGSIDIADDKWLTFNWMKEHNVACPATLLYQESKQFLEQLKDFHFPVLCKPRKGSGGEGIKKFYDQESLLNYCRRNVNEGDVIIQSFINGSDIDCSVLSDHGEVLAYTIQKRFVFAQKPVLGQQGVDFIFHEQTWNTIKELLKKLNWSGIAHIDLRIDEKEQVVKIIEINPRFWGSVMQSLFAGVNFPYITCLHALDYKIPDAEFSTKRTIQLRSAVKIILQLAIDPKRKDLYFHHIYLNQMSLNDPLPFFISKYPWLSGKLMKKKLA